MLRTVFQTGLNAAVAGLLVSLSGTAAAQQAIVIANFAYPGSDADTGLRQRALDVSETFFGLGYAVNRLENPDLAKITASLDQVSSTEGPVVIYFAGLSESDGIQTQLQVTDGETLSLADLIDQSGVDSRDATALFLDVCPNAAAEVVSATEDVAVDLTTPVAPLPARGGLFVASSVAVGMPCAPTDETLTDTMLARLAVPGLDTRSLFDGTSVAASSTLNAPLVFRHLDSGMRLTAADYRTLEELSPEAQTQMIARWQAAGIPVDRADDQPQPGTGTPPRRATAVLASPIRPVRSAATLAPVTPITSTVGSRVTIAPSTPAATLVSAPPRPVPGAGDLPRPSIIVGLIAPTDASFGTAIEPGDPIAGASIDYTDIDGRRAFRDADPTAFAGLLDAGAFDPPPQELIVALQTELAAMNCYNSRVDGQWGPGSRGSVARYYEQLGQAAPSQDPEVAVFRQIALRDDVRCPDVVRAPPPPRTTARSNTSRPRANPTPAPAATPAPTPAPVATPSRRITNPSMGNGVLR